MGGVIADVQPNCDRGTRYTAGTVVRLRARPRKPYGFSSWSGDGHGDARTATVTMNGNKVVIANFSTNAICHPFLMTVLPPGAGTVRLDPPPNCNGGTGYPEGTEVSFFATPMPGFAFGGWYGDYFDVNPEGSIEMDGPKSIVAQFARPATNDTVAAAVDFGNATNFSYTEDTSDASSSLDDPDTCADGKGGKTVWFKFTAKKSGLLTITTDGSNYHTVVQVLTGSPLKRTACSDTSLSLANVVDYEDVVASDELAGVIVPVAAGETYLIEIADATEPQLEQRELNLDEDFKDFPDGGLLQVHAAFSESPIRRRPSKK